MGKSVFSLLRSKEIIAILRKLQVQVGHLHGRNLVATSVGQDGSFWFPSWAMLPQPEAA